MAKFYSFLIAARACLLLACLCIISGMASAQQRGVSTYSLPPDDGGDPQPYCNAISLRLVSEDCSQAVLQAYPPQDCTFSYTLEGPQHKSGVGKVVNFTVTANGTYTLTARSSNETFYSSPVTVSKISGADSKPTITANHSTMLCQGEQVTLTASPASSYRWSSGATSQSITVGTAGNYTVTTTNSYGCSATSAATSVVVNPHPMDNTIRASAATICLGQSVTITSSSGTGIPYYWCSTNGGNQSWDVFSEAYGGQSSFTHTPASTGTYTYHVKNRNECGFCWDNGGSCGPEQVVHVTVVPLSIVSITSSTGLGTSPSTALTASMSDNSEATYTWSPAAGLNTISGQLVKANPSTVTTYTVTATSASGCLSTASVTVEPNNHNYIVENTMLVKGVRTQQDLDGLTVEQRQQVVTYFDGLGRRMQTVQTQGSPKKMDIVQPVEYDAFGRESKKYLPYAASGTAGSYRSTALTDVISFYQQEIQGVGSSPYPYAETEFEASPLNRVQQQGAPGDVWQPASSGVTGSGHTVKLNYRANAAEEVRLWAYAFDSGKFTSPGFYEAGQLYVTKTRDEEENLTVEYTDKQGRVVMKRVELDEETGFADTHSVYDDLGNLRLVIQPQGVRQLTASEQAQAAEGRRAH